MPFIRKAEGYFVAKATNHLPSLAKQLDLVILMIYSFIVIQFFCKVLLKQYLSVFKNIFTIE